MQRVGRGLRSSDPGCQRAWWASVSSSESGASGIFLPPLSFSQTSPREPCPQPPGRTRFSVALMWPTGSRVLQLEEPSRLVQWLSTLFLLRHTCKGYVTCLLGMPHPSIHPFIYSCSRSTALCQTCGALSHRGGQHGRGPALLEPKF